MKTPSVKALIAYGLTREQAKLVKRLGKVDDDREALSKLIEEECPETWAYARSCYNDPFASQMWRTTMVLHAIDKIVGTYGVEPLGRVRMREGPPYEYLNAGDSYTTTLVYKRRTDNLYFSSWATIAERLPKGELE